jgi:hypothetical protein
MRNYKFIVKPLFFILSLVFSSWLVLWIEKIRPSDFNTKAGSGKSYLKKLALDYKVGFIDSVELDQRLEQFLTRTNNYFPKQ